MKRFLVLAIGFFFLSSIEAIEPQALVWEIGYTKGDPDDLTWVKASVPGAVQLDVARAEGYGPYAYAENW